jgi:hypothetical protein
MITDDQQGGNSVAETVVGALASSTLSEVSVFSFADAGGLTLVACSWADNHLGARASSIASGTWSLTGSLNRNWGSQAPRTTLKRDATYLCLLRPRQKMLVASESLYSPP